MIEKRKFYAPSSDGVHTLSGYVYLPEGKIKGLFQVVHGMTEHITRYDKFLTEISNEGWLAFGYDHLGHGETVKDDSELGFIAEKNGWERLCEDVKVFSDAVRREFASEDTPYCLMGHSMGSFIARLAAERYVKPSRLIIMGTAGKNPAADIAIMLINIIKRTKGEKHISNLIENLAFGSYNKRFGKNTDSDPKMWLSTLEETRRVYYNDKYCMFRFTVSAMGDLIKLMKYSNSRAWYENLPSEMKILLVSGEDDPVGGYGKGVREVERKLQKSGKSTACKIYPHARNEILNDFTYPEVLADIKSFLS